MFEFISELNPWWSQNGWKIGCVGRILINNVLNSIRNSQYVTVLKGTRQCGKTFLIKQTIEKLVQDGVDPKAISYFLFDDPDLTSLIENEPAVFRAYIQNEAKKHTRYYVVLDEFQRVKGLTNIVKIFYEAGSNIKWMLSGSSQLLVSDKVSESLLGRTDTFVLHPFSFAEIVSSGAQEIGKAMRQFLLSPKDSWDALESVYNKLIGELEFSIRPKFNRFILTGGYPQAALAQDNSSAFLRLKELKQVYIERDIIQMLKIEKWQEFDRLMSALALMSGRLVNYDNLQSDISISFQTLKKFLSVLDSTFMAHALANWTSGKLASLKKTPKIFFEDNGLRNYLSRTMDDVSLSKEKGAIIETFIYNQLTKLISWQKNGMAKIYFWRNKQGNEVDFILEDGKHMLPIEAKSGNLKNPPRGLREFMNRADMWEAVILSNDRFGKIDDDNHTFYYIPHILFGLMI